MLQFNKELDYALQLLCVLDEVESGKCLSLRQFSHDRGISFLFLQRIARKLRQAGVIRSTQGACGGYMLDKDLKKLSLKQLIEIIDGPYAVMDCLRSDCSCANLKICQTHRIFKKINSSLTDYLENIKITDLLKE